MRLSMGVASGVGDVSWIWATANGALCGNGDISM